MKKTNKHAAIQVTSIQVTDAEKFEAVEFVLIMKSGRTTNVEVTLTNGDVFESEGEHGPNDFLEYGFKLSQS